jgi:hypothetical protein
LAGHTPQTLQLLKLPFRRILLLFVFLFSKLVPLLSLTLFLYTSKRSMCSPLLALLLHQKAAVPLAAAAF